MSTTQTPLETEVRGYLRNRSQNGNSYVKTSTIATSLGEDSRTLTPIVRGLVDEGMLEVWSAPEGNAKTYRIVASGGDGA